MSKATQPLADVPTVSEVLLLAPAFQLFQIKFILTWPVGAVFSITAITFSFLLCILYWCKLKITWGSLRREYWPPVSWQHSFTYSELSDRQRGALTSGRRDQDDSLEFYGNFFSAVTYQCSAPDCMQIFYQHLQLNVAGSIILLLFTAAACRFLCSPTLLWKLILSHVCKPGSFKFTSECRYFKPL